jgi:glycosyltransferase involved in cell wall biosynthesis
VKKILIVNSYISWGGLGQYSIQLSKIIKSDYHVFGLVTHSLGERFDEFVALTEHTYYVGNCRKIRKYIKCFRYINKLNPDYIFINYNGTIQFLLPFINSCKIISVIHNDINDFYRISTINFKYVSSWIAPSIRIKTNFLTYSNNRISEEKIQVISHGVETLEIVDRKLNLADFNICFIGALYEHKGIIHLPFIINRLFEICANCHLNIYGDGILQQYLVEKLKTHLESNRVSINGLQSHEKILNVLSKTDVLLFPTRVEAFGLIIAEAMMAGAVPVVSLIEGITDVIVDDSVNGFLINMDDDMGFVDRLQRLYSDRILLYQLSKNAREKARQKYSINNMKIKYVELIESLD